MDSKCCTKASTSAGPHRAGSWPSQAASTRRSALSRCGGVPQPGWCAKDSASTGSSPMRAAAAWAHRPHSDGGGLREPLSATASLRAAVQACGEGWASRASRYSRRWLPLSSPRRALAMAPMALLAAAKPSAAAAHWPWMACTAAWKASIRGPSRPFISPKAPSVSARSQRHSASARRTVPGSASGAWRACASSHCITGAQACVSSMKLATHSLSSASRSEG